MPAPTATDRALVRRRLLSLLDLRPGDAVLVASPFAAELVGALSRAAPGGRVRALVSDLRAAEAAAAAGGLHPEVSLRVLPGVTLAEAWGRRGRDDPWDPPDVVLLWPDGREGHARIAAQVREAASHLPPGGRLYLVSFRQLGAARLVATVREAFGAAEILARGPRGARIVRAVKSPTSATAAAVTAAPGAPAIAAPSDPRGEAAEPKATIRADVLGRSFVFRAGPGVFARQGLDPGTRLLLETLLEAPPGPERTALDLGCGYGPLGIILAAHRPALRVTLVDVDARAVSLARENAARNGVTGNTAVRLSDGLRHLPGETFDLVVSNFPLHVGRSELARLLREVRDALLPTGRLYLAALAAYDLRPAVRAVFGSVCALAEAAPPGARSGPYRVLRAPAPAGD